jgi:hypothetical protein
MNEFDLPNELAAIERALAGRHLANPPRELRARVLDSIRQQQAASWPASGPSQQGWWTFVTSIAAAVAIWANLSFSALAFGVRSNGPSASHSIDHDAALLHELIPDLTLEDARLQAVRLSAGLRASPPRLHSTSHNMHAG